MSKRDDLIVKYAADLKEKCNVTADMDFLRKVTIGCGPSIYNRDASTVSASDPSELATVKNNFLIKKLGLTGETAELDAKVMTVCETMQKDRMKSRVTFYYLLAKNEGKLTAL